MEFSDYATAAYWTLLLPGKVIVAFHHTVAIPGVAAAWQVEDDLGIFHPVASVQVFLGNLRLNVPTISLPRYPAVLWRTLIPIDGYNVLGQPLAALTPMPIQEA